MYRSNIEKVGKIPEYVLNPSVKGRKPIGQTKEVMPVDNGAEEEKKVANG